MSTNLYQRYRDLQAIGSAQKRGYEFEEWFQQLLFEAGLSVIRNPHTARPRQTDLIANRGSLRILFELKWRSKRADTNDVDSLISRLDRTQPNVVGCLVSMAHFTEEAIDEVVLHRNREILLFTISEIDYLARSPLELLKYIEAKRNTLHVSAEVLFVNPKDSIESGEYIALPYEIERIITSKSTLPYLGFRSDSHNLIFARDIPDFSGGAVSSKGMSLHLPLNLSGPDAIEKSIGLVHNHLHLGKDGTFAIHHLSHSWVGRVDRLYPRLLCLGASANRYRGTLGIRRGEFLRSTVCG